MQAIAPHTGHFFQEAISPLSSNISGDSAFYSTNPNSSYSKLQKQLSRLLVCFPLAINPSNSTDLSITNEASQTGYRNQENDLYNSTNDYRRPSPANVGRTTDYGIPGNSAFERQMTNPSPVPLTQPWNRSNVLSYSPTPKPQEATLTTIVRIQSLVWRQLMASLSHHLVGSLISNGKYYLHTNHKE